MEKITLRHLSNGNATAVQLAAMQGKLIQAYLLAEEASSFIASHYYPDHVQDMREAGDLLKAIATAMQPDLAAAEKYAKAKLAGNAGAKVFSGGSHIQDGKFSKPIDIAELNRKNREHWEGK